MSWKNGVKRERERTYPRNERVAWGAAGGGRLRRGTIRDVSVSGVGLLVDEPEQPAAGEAIRVMTRLDRCGRRARVVRVVPGPEGATLLGCRWISPVRCKRLRSSEERRDLRRAVGHRTSDEATPIGKYEVG
jgi:hypothetical protein